MDGDAFDVVVVGSCNMDLISYTPRFPKAGETITGHKFRMGCGGKGANQCVMAAKLSAKSAMVGRVGNDAFGDIFYKDLKNLKINTDCLKVTPGLSTGVAPISVNNEGENSIIIVKGANDEVSDEDLRDAMHILKSAKVVICQLEIRPDVSLAALKLAKKLGAMTIFNPAPAVKGLSPEFLEASEIVCCNESEAEILTGSSVASLDECKRAVGELLNKGIRKVILTLGSKGALCATSSEPNPVYVPAVHVNAVDTTGAGDAFIGSLAYYLARHKDLPLQEMVQRAAEIAAISVTAEGTQSSYPTHDSLPKHLFS